MKILTMRVIAESEEVHTQVLNPNKSKILDSKHRIHIETWLGTTIEVSNTIVAVCCTKDS